MSWILDGRQVIKLLRRRKALIDVFSGFSLPVTSLIIPYSSRVTKPDIVLD